MKEKSDSNGTVVSSQDVYIEDDTENVIGKKREAEIKRFGKGLALSVAYGANAGGIATLTGTPPNLILQGQANR